MNTMPLVYPLTIKVNVPEQVLKDILCTALEGGTNYWLCGERVQRDRHGYTRLIRPSDAEMGLRNLQPFPVDQFKPGFDPKADITLQTVLRGLELVAGGALPQRADLMGNVMRIVVDAHDFDASDADVIVQLGFFGDVIYS